MRSALVGLVGLGLGFGGAARGLEAAHAQAAPVDALLTQAETKAAAGDYVGAATDFRQAYEASGNQVPEYLCNVGVAYQRAMIWPRAHAYLSECLVQGTALDAAFVALVKEALVEVEATLRAGSFAPVSITVAPARAAVGLSTFGRDETLPGPRTVWVPFGTLSITVAAPGHEAQVKEVVITTSAPQAVSITLAPSSVAPPVRAAVSAPARSAVPAIVASSVTVVVGAGALVSYLRARSRSRDAESTTITRPEFDALVDSAESWQHLSWGLAGAAALGAGVSGYLWYRYATSAAAIEVAPSASGATVSFSTRW